MKHYIIRIRSKEEYQKTLLELKYLFYKLNISYISRIDLNYFNNKGFPEYAYLFFYELRNEIRYDIFQAQLSEINSVSNIFLDQNDLNSIENILSNIALKFNIDYSTTLSRNL